MYLSTFKTYIKFSNMTDLLKSLILVSEKAANIARICRQNKLLFNKLIEEKTSDANPRFFQDFKTLADVLIQESVRHDISKKFPELKEFIKGEENNTFSNTAGDSIIVIVEESETETSDLLQKVCNDALCAEILAKEVHREITFDDTKEVTSNDFPIFEIDNIKDLAIWIDPIDSTAEYIQGVSQESKLPGVLSNGLLCATVLIGVYNRSSGLPILGVINQPFYTKHDDRYQSKIFWGIAHDSIRMHSEKNNIKTNNEDLIVAVSRIEEPELINFLLEQGVKIVPLAGAGYKILNVILDNCDCFLLSKKSVYTWDICGPHAILKSMGGDILQFNESLSHSEKSTDDLNIKYNGDTRINGLIAYKNPSKLKQLLGIINNKSY